MSLGRTYYILKGNLIHSLRCRQAAWRWGKTKLRHSPIVFGNAMAKSGSNLLRQILNGLHLVGAFMPADPWPLRTISQSGEKRARSVVLEDLNQYSSGEVRWGYLPADTAYIRKLSSNDWASFFLYRDPRDLLVSHVFYATEIYPDHSMNSIYRGLPDMPSRINVAITGTAEYPHLPSVRGRYEAYLGYLEANDIFKIRFEDLVNKQENAIRNILTWIQARGGVLEFDPEAAATMLAESADPADSPTFRQGRTGSWRQHFSEENKSRFKEVAGDLLMQLGYEAGDDW